MVAGIFIFIISVLLPLIVLYGVDYFLFFNEITIFRLLSYKWVIAMYIIVVIVFTLIYIGIVKRDNHRIVGVLGIIFTVIAAIAMMCSIVVSRHVQIYTVETNADFKALSNVPKINNYRILIKCDIDFGGEEITIGGTFENDIKGGGHTLSNFTVNGAIFDTVKGNISGVNFENVKISRDKNYEEKDLGKADSEKVICFNNEGNITNVNAANIEIKHAYDNSGCGCGENFGITMVVLFWVFIGIGYFVFKALGKI